MDKMYETMVFKTLGNISEMTVNQHLQSTERKKSGQHRILYPAKFPFKNEEKVKSSNLQKLNEFIIITHTLLEI